MNCFDCGDEGHMARDCPNNALTDTGSRWCGICDQRTRLVGVSGDRLQRCPECHPKRHEHLRQVRRCPGCKVLVYEWDNAPCGQHASPAVRDRKPPIEHIRDITGRTA